ncbi:aldo/keto reductase [Kitasatospora sp. NPDC057015]|uniref:aldo/keto reductase n=1 Tax=Kitasatospora sp. NPDC057015 TaxID=3346001 RepID=UPI00364132BE
MRPADRRIVLGLHRSRHQRRTLTSALDLGITSLDTSFNYRGFTSHTTLTTVGGDLLPRFAVSTKVGYFPVPGGAEHSLDPDRLRAALEQTNRDLGRPPDFAFLHNPEASAQAEGPGRPEKRLAAACTALAEAAASGLCGAWGVSSWNPQPLVGLIDRAAPTPDVLMLRAGLLVHPRALDAAEAVASQWGLLPPALWGMSPFGGSATDRIWSAFDPRLFLRDAGSGLSRAQAAFRVSYLLPGVSAVAVGADDPEHQSQLADCLGHEVDEEKLVQYRQLLRSRSRRHAA